LEILFFFNEGHRHCLLSDRHKRGGWLQCGNFGNIFEGKLVIYLEYYPGSLQFRKVKYIGNTCILYLISS
jgi:hypothetical protein